MQNGWSSQPVGKLHKYRLFNWPASMGRHGGRSSVTPQIHVVAIDNWMWGHGALPDISFLSTGRTPAGNKMEDR